MGSIPFRQADHGGGIVDPRYGESLLSQFLSQLAGPAAELHNPFALNMVPPEQRRQERRGLQRYCRKALVMYKCKVVLVRFNRCRPCQTLRAEPRPLQAYLPETSCPAKSMFSIVEIADQGEGLWPSLNSKSGFHLRATATGASIFPVPIAS